MSKFKVFGAYTKEESQRERDHRILARRAAADGMVLLKNDGVLPLENKSIALYGVGARMTVKGGSGIVYVDGEALEEDYIREPTYTAEGTEFPLTVPEGSIFVMGDNRNGSSDSRDYRLGTVDTRYVIGKAAFLIFPGPDYETEKRDFKRIGVIWS